MSEKPESLGDLDLEALNFEQLSGVYEKVGSLAEKTFKRDGDCFRNMSGTMVVSIKKDGERYVLSTLFGPTLHHYVAFSSVKVLNRSGSSDKEELVRAIEDMIKNLGNRLIE
jgi:hypothetical protein